MQVVRSDQLVMPRLKMFCKIVGKIFLSWMPCDVKILYLYLIGYPKEIFLHGARSLFFNGVICDGYCGGVVAVYWCWRLLMSQLLQCEPLYGAILTVVEKCT